LFGSVLAQEEKPDATLKLSKGQVAIGIGWSWGDGVLTFKGKHHPFKVDGLSVVDVGITKASAVGKVYHLKKLSDFNGTYASAAAEGTLGGGAGASTMKNQNGVVIQLISTTQGVNIKLAGEGVKFTLE
jgi:plastocyanin domain-containing protein